MSLPNVTASTKELVVGLKQVEDEVAIVKRSRKPLEGDRFVSVMEVSRLSFRREDRS